MSRDPTERLPNVVKEAMLQHCVPVVTRTAGIEELVTDGVDGFVVPQGDVAAAIDRVGQVLSSAAFRDALAKRARAKVLETFDVERLTQRRLEVWSDLVSLRRDAEPRQRQGGLRPSSSDPARG
jgi:glycosyltransferase involved in cell wall biosynthesis